MSKERSIVVVICLALFAVFCFAVTADAAGGCKDRDNDGYFNKANCGTAVDCNDNNAAVNPGAVEECTDSIDNDCDGLVDMQDSDAVNCPVCLNDNDGDGYYTDGGSCGSVDCNDNDPAINPGAVEICDDAGMDDEDCDGLANDNDSDCVAPGCSDYANRNECSNDPNCEWVGSRQNGSCQDACSITENPEVTCNDGIDNDCDGNADTSDSDCLICTDNDGDGYNTEGGGCGPVDCNDNDSAVNPGAAEGPNGDPTCSDTVDNDCDGLIDTAQDPGCEPFDCSQFTKSKQCRNNSECMWQDGMCIPVIICTDSDGDGYNVEGGSCGAVDCNDADPAINPGSSDANCNGIDDDCDGSVDEDYVITSTSCGVGECGASGQLECQSGAEIDTCTPLPAGTEGPEGDPTCSDTLDNDCDGALDSADGDCKDTAAPLVTGTNIDDGAVEILLDLQMRIYWNEMLDCATVNTSSVTISPAVGGTQIICNGFDADLIPSGQAMNTIYTVTVSTAVTDVAGNPMASNYEMSYTTLTGCVDNDGDGWTTCDGDCADDRDWINPGATEICDDLIDNDCDLLFDLWDTQECCTDADGDGWNAEGFPCGMQDCDDSNPSINPSVLDDTCDGFDDNCNFAIDDDYVASTTQCGVGVCESTGLLDCIGGTEVDDCTAGSPTENPEATCDDTLDNDCDGLTDNNDPGCTDSADAPHDMIVDCTACHDPGTYVLNAVIPNSKCLGCHDFGAPGTLAGGSDIKVETHHIPEDMNCGVCHNVMRSQLPNIKHVRTSLAVFTANATGADFADSSGTKICETCHTITAYYRNDGTGAPHVTDVCTNCHTHDQGFNTTGPPHPDAPHDMIFDCAGCHDPGTYIPNAPLDNAKCQACHDSTAPGTGSGGSDLKVSTHFSDLYTDPTTGLLVNVNCVECHNPALWQTNLKHIRSTIRGLPVVFTSYTGPNSFADGDAVYDGICEVCHTQTNHHQADGNAPGGQSHNDGVDCRACHDHQGGGFLPL